MEKSEKDKVLNGLEQDLDMWDRYCFISHHGALIANLVWAGIVFRSCLVSDAEMFKKAVLGLLAAFRPWAAWVFKALELNAGFEIDRTAHADGKLQDNDIVVFRYADVLLMRAEAKVRNGDSGYADLNAVITDAVGNYVTDVKNGAFPNESESY